MGGRRAHRRRVTGDPGSLAAQLAGSYFTTPHFDGYPAVLVRLGAIGVPELDELITEAWLAQAPKTLARKFLQNR